MSQINVAKLDTRVVASLAGLYASRMLGLFMVLPVLALYIDDYRGASPLWLGLIIGAYGLTQAALQIPLGLLSDRIGRRPVIVGGLLLFLLGSVVAALADSVWGLLCGRLLQGSGAIASTTMALVSDLTSDENRAKAMAAIGGSIGLSFMLAMVVGPLLAANGGMALIFWVTALLAALGLVLFLTAVPVPLRSTANREVRPDLSQLKSVLVDANLARLNVGIFTLHLLLMAAFVVIPALLVEQLGIAANHLWWVYIALLGGGFVVMVPLLIIGEKLAKHRTVMLLAIAALGLALLGLNQTALLWPVLLLLLLFFAGFNLLEAMLPSWLSKACPAGYRGTAMGVYSSCQFLGAFCGGLLGGWSLQHYGSQTLFMLLAGLALLWWLLALGLAQPKLRKTLVLQRDDRSPQQFASWLSGLAGVDEVLQLEGDRLVYIKVDQSQLDRSKIEHLLG
ncbi:MFS transporter [Gammaproteobacteria bacterium LSUCC0057]|uniref:MFS transporter n=1 Tax=Gammaproteobacteria bacterium LSUCC0057 TaxID=2559237 RepID=A0A4Y8ULN1_9GAMM|nr:MFS transporter [Gammaproteobacteria bacterium LSUCC0057]